MSTNTKFDLVHDSQRVFRILLKAIANPGTWFDYSEIASKFEDGQLILPLVLTLCDNEANYWINGCSDGLSNEIAILSGSHFTSLLQADFAFVTADTEPESILSLVRPGSYEDPHESTSLFVIAQDSENECSFRFTGPGVKPGGCTAELSQSFPPWVKARDAISHEYPLGVDMIFIHPEAKMLGFPRMTKGEIL